MRLIIDSDICTKYNFSVDEILLLLLIMRGQDVKDQVKNLIGRGLVQKNDDGYTVSESVREMLDKIVLESGNASEKRLSTLAMKMQKCFPEGKPYGSITYYRANKREIIFRLQSFFKQYGDFPDEEIVDATRRFVESFHGNYKYLPVITNFIIKTSKTTDSFGNPVIENTSQLATQLENKDDTGHADNNDDSWLFSNRN